MKNRFLSFIKNHLSIILTIMIFTTISVINSSRHIGLIEDGVHHFWEAITSANIWIGHEGFSHFPYNSRFFPSILSHLGTGLAVKAGILNIGVLLYIFTIISYLSPLFFLVIIYLNLPENKKEYFDIILLSFSICVTFMIYQIWTENLITGLFLWIIFVIYYYADFNKLSYLNIFSLIIFPIAIISSHPMVVVFIPILLFIGVKKYSNTNHTSGAIIKTILICSFVILTFAFIFNFYFILHPVFNATSEYMQAGIFYSAKMIRLCLSILLILFISTRKNIKNKKIYNFIYIIACINVFDNTLFNIQSSDSYPYRILGFYLVLFFMIFTIIIKSIKNTVYIKIINIIIMVLLFVNSLYYTKIWSNYLSDINRYFIEKQQINILYDSKGIIYTSQPVFFQVAHTHLHPFVLLIIPKLYATEENRKHELNVYLELITFFNFYNKNIIERKDILKRFGINIDDSLKINFEKEKV